MKRLIIVLGMVAALNAYAQDEKKCRIVKDNYDELRIELTIDQPSVGETSICGEQFSTLTLDGYLPSDNVGEPSLPTLSKLIEVPLCNDFRVEVIDAVYDTLGALPRWLAPTQVSRTKSDTTTPRLFMDKELYKVDKYYGQQEALVEAVGIARDRRLARLQFSPVRYNPATGQYIVCRNAILSVRYIGADKEATLEMFERYHTPAFPSGNGVINSLYPKSVATAAPVRYLIVAHSSFRGQMDSFVSWKQRKGFITDIVYTDDAAVGSTTTSIQAYLQSQYTNATATSPAPTYVLFVGDVQQIPAFNGNQGTSSHITDLYYISWTSSDIIPDCYGGRFSAQTVSQLTPQIQKTLMYEQYTFADPSFLDRAVMVAGVDGGSSGDNGYTYGDPAMDYAVTNYINGANGWANVYYYKNNTSIAPSGVTNVTLGSNGSSNLTTIRNLYNQGAGLINYTAHGGSTGWSNPNFGNDQVETMSNNQKFGLMIGNCCQTNMYGESSCFGESLLRKNNYAGAVGYIGGSDYTYWTEDFYWTVGVRSGIGPSMSMAYDASNLGAYDRACHTHGEAFSEWMTSQGAIMMAGNMTVQASTSSRKGYYWEIYHLMGDPSVMTYFTQPSVMTVTAPSTIPYGTTTLSVTAAPNAYVALCDTITHTLLAATWANASGQATLNLGNNIPVGNYQLSATAQNYRVAFHTLNIIAPTGAFPSVTALTPVTPLVAGDTVTLNVTVENQGNATANGLTVTFSSSSPMLTLLNNSVSIASLAIGAQNTFATVRAVVSPSAPDLTAVNITATSNWSGNSSPAVSIYPQTIVAPVPMVRYSNASPNMLPGNSTSLTAKLYNRGHADLHNWQIDVQSPTQKLNTSCTYTASSTIAAGDSVTATINISAASSLPQDISVPVYITVPYAPTTSSAIVQLTDTMDVIIGNSFCETFEGNQYHLNGWTQGTVQWIIYDTGAYSGTYCAGSSYTMGSSMTSELSISCTINRADSISFYYKVSSEANYDKFHFYMDNTDMFNASGEVDWTRAAFPVSAGTHTFRFTYEKDYSVNRGSDRAWIDNVTLPHDMHITTFEQGVICDGDTASHPDYVVNANSSVVVYDYTLMPSYAVYDDTAVCGSLDWQGTVYDTTTDIILAAGTTTHGCDSSTYLRVTVHPLQHLEFTVANFPNDTYMWNGIAYTEDGDFSQQFTDIYGCDSTVTLHLTFANQVSITGADDVTLRLFPNPTADLLHFDSTVDEVLVYDVNGRLVATEKQTKHVDLTALPAGVYTLRLTLPTGSTTCRVVKR